MIEFPSADREEVIVIQQSVNEVFSGSPAGVGGGSNRRKRLRDSQDKRQAGYFLLYPRIDLGGRRERGIRRQARGVGQQPFLAGEELHAGLGLRRFGRTAKDVLECC